MNVATSGTYTVSARVATQTANGSSLRILFDGKKVGTLAVPNTGEWQTYTTVSTQVNLEAGKHILQLRFGDAFNLDDLPFTKQ